MTVVIITHEMSVVRSICDSVSLLEAGQIVEGGPIDEVVSRVDSRLSRELVPLPEVSEKVLGRGDVVGRHRPPARTGRADRRAQP